MSSDQADILEGIKEKIQKIKFRMREQQEVNDRLKASNENLQLELQQKQSMIAELEKKNQKLSMLSGILAEGEESQDARIQINRIVREIDKCIALLNK